MSVGGRPRKIKSPKSMAEAWEEFKVHCDGQTVLKTSFSNRESRFVTQEIPASISYTIEGFCEFIGLARSTFYQIYDHDDRYSDTLRRMREEAENDQRAKFEKEILNPKLAPLWMSKFGYSSQPREEKDTTTNDLMQSILELTKLQMQQQMVTQSEKDQEKEEKLGKEGEP